MDIQIHEGLASIAECITDHLSEYDLTFVDVEGTPTSGNPWHSFNTHDTLITHVEDESGERYTITITRQPKASEVTDEAKQADESAKMSAITGTNHDLEAHPAPSEDRDDDKHVAQNGSD